MDPETAIMWATIVSAAATVTLAVFGVTSLRLLKIEKDRVRGTRRKVAGQVAQVLIKLDYALDVIEGVESRIDDHLSRLEDPELSKADRRDIVDGVPRFLDGYLTARPEVARRFEEVRRAIYVAHAEGAVISDAAAPQLADALMEMDLFTDHALPSLRAATTIDETQKSLAQGKGWLMACGGSLLAASDILGRAGSLAGALGASVEKRFRRAAQIAHEVKGEEIGLGYTKLAASGADQSQ